MTVTAVALIMFGLALGIFPVSGLHLVPLEKFAALFGLSLLRLGLLISLAGGVVLTVDLLITYYRFHPATFRGLPRKTDSEEVTTEEVTTKDAKKGQSTQGASE